MEQFVRKRRKFCFFKQNLNNILESNIFKRFLSSGENFFLSTFILDTEISKSMLDQCPNIFIILRV